ncbi:MAG TPA: amidohydrolase family protein, partial [Pedobacter sp.]
MKNLRVPGSSTVYTSNAGTMVLNNLLLADEPEPVNIRISGHQITGSGHMIMPGAEGSLQLTFEQAMVFPGLINSHDHLDFNLFPQFGTQIYNNYTEWGKYIHEHYKKEIASVLLVPVRLREEWGVLKNLICGVTTVVNHGENVKIKDPLINIYERYHCLHSVKLEKKWKTRLNHPLKLKRPVVIHTGEGTDAAAHEEIDRLIRWNLLRKTLIGVHGVAMSAAQAGKFKAIVWCPESNYFLLDKTAAVDELKAHTSILFGTDSTLTGSWNIWEHIRLARKAKRLTDTELYHTLNLNPSAVWKLRNRAVKPGNDADLVIARVKDQQAGMEAFYAIGPKDILMVIHRGSIRLFDETLLAQL